MSEKFKISGIGVDTSEINQLIPRESVGLDGIKYIHTKIGKGNDSLLKSAIPLDATLITTIDFLDQSDTAIVNHLKELDRSKIDLLLIDSKCKVEDNIDEINNLIVSGVVSEIGISNPDSVKRLEELNNSISQISCISLNICPLCFPWSIIKYCNENDIKILGFNPFGGNINYPRLIKSFSVPYLLGFAAAYSDIVFLSGRNLNIIESEGEYLFELVDKEYGKEFIMSQDVNKLPKEPKKAIYTSLKVSDSVTVPYESDDTIFSYTETLFSLGKVSISTPEETESDDLVSMIYDYYSSFSGGPFDNPTPENTLTLLRPRILDLTRLIYSEIDGWAVFCTKISDCVFVISSVRRTEEKKFLRKTVEKLEQINYILFYDGQHFIFQKLKNAD